MEWAALRGVSAPLLEMFKKMLIQCLPGMLAGNWASERIWTRKWVFQTLSHQNLWFLLLLLFVCPSPSPLCSMSLRSVSSFSTWSAWGCNPYLLIIHHLLLFLNCPHLMNSFRAGALLLQDKNLLIIDCSQPPSAPPPLNPKIILSFTCCWQSCLGLFSSRASVIQNWKNRRWEIRPERQEMGNFLVC